jgi:hypothetical protein
LSSEYRKKEANMSKFDRFKWAHKSTNRSTEPTVGVGKGGRVNFNAAAVKEYLDDYPCAKLGYDPDENELAIMFMDKDAGDAYSIQYTFDKGRKRGAHIVAKGAFYDFGIDVDNWVYPTEIVTFDRNVLICKLLEGKRPRSVKKKAA